MVKKVWCVESCVRDRRGVPAEHRKCALATQPKGPPIYRDPVKVRCGLWVVLPGPFLRDTSDCQDCPDDPDVRHP